MLFIGRQFQVWKFIGLKIFPMSMALFIAALGEELGWTGYVLENTRKKFGIVQAGLIIGVIGAFSKQQITL